MPKLTLTSGAIPVSILFVLVVGLAVVGRGGMRPVLDLDVGAEARIVTLKNFSVIGAYALASRFGGALGDIFSTALNRFSITLSVRAARASPP